MHGPTNPKFPNIKFHENLITCRQASRRAGRQEGRKADRRAGGLAGRRDGGQAGGQEGSHNGANMRFFWIVKRVMISIIR